MLADKRRNLRIGVFLITVFILVYIPSLVHWIYGRSIATDFIRIGTIEEAINTEGYFVRDEEVLKSPFEGKCIPAAEEGERIPSDSIVATILKESTRKLYDDLNDLELRILQVQREKSENQEFFSQDIVRMDSEINKNVKYIIDQGNENNLTKISQIKEDINGVIQKKAAIIGSKSPADNHLNALLKDREKLKEQINQSKKEIVSGSAGIVSFTTDGYEALLQPGGIKNLTPKFLDGIKVKGNAINFAGKNVEVDKPFAKVIKDFEYYIVVALEEEQTKAVKVDDYIKVRVTDLNKVLDTKVNYKSNLQEGRFIIGLKLDKAISETAGFRKANMDLIKRSLEGYRVPIKSLMNIDRENMTARIMLVKSNYASPRDVKIKGMDDEFAVIENVNDAYKNTVGLYDIFVLNPNNIQEGQMINP